MIRINKISLIVLSILCIVTLQAGIVQGKLDINNAAPEEIASLDLSDEALYLVEEYLLYHGEVESIYEFQTIEKLSYEDFLVLKESLAIFPKEGKTVSDTKIEDRYYRLESMMNDEGTSEGLVETWIDLFTNPRDVNGMTYYDLLNLPAVSPIDAAAVIRHMEKGNEIKSARDLRGIEGISYYGYRNIRDYVRYDNSHDAKWNGYFTGIVKDFAAQITPEDGESLMDVLVYDKYPLDVYYKGHLNYGNKVQFGFSYSRALGEENPTVGTTVIPEMKHYVGFQDISLGKLGKVNKVIFGNFTAAFGQGIILETSDYSTPRKTGYGWKKRMSGVSGDVSRGNTYNQYGVSGEYQFKSLYVTPFFAYNTRDAVINSDSSFSALIRMEPRLADGLNGDLQIGMLDSLHEMMYGSNIRFQPVPEAHLGFTFYESLYDRELDFQPEIIIANVDKYLNQYGNSGDPEIEANYESIGASTMWKKAKSYRRVMGADFSVALKNVVFQGELGILDKNGNIFDLQGDAIAWTANMYWQFENMNMLFLYRDYDVAFDNPYQRSFSNYSRYKSTIFEDIYYLNDPTYGFLYTGTAQPQSEKGFYFSTRYQLSRSLIMNLEHDIWQRVADGAKYNRLVGRLEYRPVFNYRIRLRQKWQARYKDNYLSTNLYKSYETILTNQFNLSSFDRLAVDIIYSYTEFSPRARLVYTTAGGSSYVGSAGSPSRGIRATFTHNVNKRFKVLGSAMVYNGFIWNFEDTDFRITDSPVDAFRGWLTLYTRLTDNMSLRFKYTVDTSMDQDNIVGAYVQLDDGSTYQISTLMHRVSTHDFRLQLDYRF